MSRPGTRNGFFACPFRAMEMRHGIPEGLTPTGALLWLIGMFGPTGREEPFRVPGRDMAERRRRGHQSGLSDRSFWIMSRYGTQMPLFLGRKYSGFSSSKRKDLRPPSCARSQKNLRCS